MPLDRLDVDRLWFAARDALQRARDDDARAEAAAVQASLTAASPAADAAARRFRVKADRSERAACESALSWHRAHLRGRVTDLPTAMRAAEAKLRAEGR